MYSDSFPWDGRYVKTTLYPLPKRRLVMEDPTWGVDEPNVGPATCEPQHIKQAEAKLNQDAEVALMRYKTAITSWVSSKGKGTSRDFICLVSACGAAFATPRELQVHVTRNHLHRCLVCGAGFLLQRWADLHAHERHSELFAAMVERARQRKDASSGSAESGQQPQQHLFECWIDGCSARLSSEQDREHHMVRRHWVWKTAFSRAKGGQLRSLEACLEHAMAVLTQARMDQQGDSSTKRTLAAGPVPLCTYHRLSSGCRDGDKCRFRHEGHEPTSTSASGGREEQGSAPMTHVSTQQATVESSVNAPSLLHIRSKPCYYHFMRVNGGAGCKKGDACPFYHDQPLNHHHNEPSTGLYNNNTGSTAAVTSSASAWSAMMMDAEADHDGTGGNHDDDDDDDDELSHLMMSSLSLSRRAPPKGASLTFGHRGARRGGTALDGRSRGTARGSLAKAQQGQAAAAQGLTPTADLSSHGAAPDSATDSASAGLSSSAPAASGATSAPKASILAFRPRALAVAKKPATSAVAPAMLAQPQVAPGAAGTVERGAMGSHEAMELELKE